MATSQNGWTVHTNQNNLAHLSWVTGRVMPGDVHRVFDYLCRRFNAEVEPIRKDWSWGWAYRPVRGKTTGFSNHASGTAIDLNAPSHPIGKRGTFTSSKVKVIRDILRDLEGAVEWGGNYSNRPDEMHFEINTSPARLREIVRKVSSVQVTDIERFLDTMDKEQFVEWVRDALYLPLANHKSGDSALDGSVNNAIYMIAARTRPESQTQVVLDALNKFAWSPVVPDHEGIPGSSWRNNMLHQTNSTLQSLALLRSFMEGQGIKVDMEKMTKDLVEAIIPQLRDSLSEEIGEEAARRTVDKLAKKLSQ